jgi:hypothetical protein
MTGRAEKPSFLFAHGAGAGKSSAWMRKWCERLEEIADVETFDYPYITRGRRTPDPLPVLIAAHRQALHERQSIDARKVVLVGKSMGSRIGCHVALEEAVAGVVCFGYPLVAPGNSGKIRDAVLKDLRVPVLFLQGTRDPLCPLAMLEAVRKELRVESFLHVVEDGNHSLEVTATKLRQSGRTEATIEEAIVERIATFVAALPS